MRKIFGLVALICLAIPIIVFFMDYYEIIDSEVPMYVKDGSVSDFTMFCFLAPIWGIAYGLVFIGEIIRDEMWKMRDKLVTLVNWITRPED